MLLALAYHRAGPGRYGNDLSLLKDHFAFIATNYPTALPGEPIRFPLTLCLTFDDATFDFYHLIYPLLKKYRLKAVLAVPTAFIPNAVALSSAARLRYIKSLKIDTLSAPSPAFCSWDELKELSQSPLIEIASHSVHHVPLTAPQISLSVELGSSKVALETALACCVTTFVYPYGAFQRAIHRKVKKHYTYAMRLGGALNVNWGGKNKLLYRANADALSDYRGPFAPSKQIRYLSKFFLNFLRRK